MPIEVEARFRADGSAPLDELAGRHQLGSAMLGPARTVDEVDRYLDTADLRLAVARWACRLREREQRVRLSLKGPAEPQAEGWHHRRPELEGPASHRIEPDSWPASEALDLLNELRAGQRLHERLRLLQRRTERSVELDGVAIATLSLDRVRMSGGGTDLGELLVVELELAAESTAEASRLEHLASILAGVAGLAEEPRSKLEHALERLAAKA